MLGITTTAWLMQYDVTGVGPQHDPDDGQRRSVPEGQVEALKQAN
jgi:hypothetical protein